MRQIKFRAWDKYNKRFIYVTLHPTHIGWASPYFIAQGLLRGSDESVEGVGFAGIEGWEQYTGLKDKNGKEIYEGDIVRNIPSAFAREECQGQIVWFSGHCRFAMSRTDHYLDMINTYEVVGNIYENPI